MDEKEILFCRMVSLYQRKEYKKRTDPKVNRFSSFHKKERNAIVIKAKNDSNKNRKIEKRRGKGICDSDIPGEKLFP